MAQISCGIGHCHRPTGYLGFLGPDRRPSRINLSAAFLLGLIPFRNLQDPDASDFRPLSTAAAAFPLITLIGCFVLGGLFLDAGADLLVLAILAAAHWAQ